MTVEGEHTVSGRKMDNHPDEGHSRTENPKHSTAGVEQLSQVSPP